MRKGNVKHIAPKVAVACATSFYANRSYMIASRNYAAESIADQMNGASAEVMDTIAMYNNLSWVVPVGVMFVGFLWVLPDVMELVNKFKKPDDSGSESADIYSQIASGDIPNADEIKSGGRK